MSFIDPAVEQEVLSRVSTDLSQLGKIHASKSSKFHVKSVDHSLVEDMLAEGWVEFGQPRKTKTQVRRPKSHDVQFEDDVWCQLYRLGFRCFNVGRDLKLPFGRTEGERKQIDILAVNKDCILLIECKSSEQSTKPPSFKTEFEALRLRLDGHRKALDQIFGPGRRVKYLLATRNIRISRDSADAARLIEAGGYLYNDNAYDYVEALLRTYKGAAHYQFMAMLFKGQDINKERIEVPAIEGRMGADRQKYYMFSLEPELLLKIGYVLHRTSANEAQMPTYQRLLVPSRLKGITKFIDDGGFFPNSVILNFSEGTKKIEFQPNGRVGDAQAKTGVLKVPNCYAIAYIIDGQHRIYGYSDTKHKLNDTIPVVAFVDLEPSDQLEMFMNINQNQKAVSRTLRTTLEEDLYWSAARLDSRMKALRSSIVRQLGEDRSGPLYGKISLGEDKAELLSTPFADALLRCGLLPQARGNRFMEEGMNRSLYDVSSLEHDREMRAARTRIVSFVNGCYELAEKFFHGDEATLKKYIMNNRGTYAFISLVGSLNSHLTGLGKVNLSSSAESRVRAVEDYLSALFLELQNIGAEDAGRLLGKLGSGAETTWLRMFQNYVGQRKLDYAPMDLRDWRERQDQELQHRGRQLGVEIERHLKIVTIGNLKAIFGSNWDIEIGSIKRSCTDRAEVEIEKNYKEGLGRKDIPWTDMLGVSDYRTIIEKYWGRSPDPAPEGFKTFEEHFALDIGQGFNSKAEKLRWLSFFGSYRNTWAHEGTKEKGLNYEEVAFLRKVHDRLLH